MLFTDKYGHHLWNTHIYSLSVYIYQRWRKQSGGDLINSLTFSSLQIKILQRLIWLIIQSERHLKKIIIIRMKNRIHQLCWWNYLWGGHQTDRQTNKQTNKQTNLLHPFGLKKYWQNPWTKTKKSWKYKKETEQKCFEGLRISSWVTSKYRLKIQCFRDSSWSIGVSFFQFSWLPKKTLMCPTRLASLWSRNQTHDLPNMEEGELTT